MMAILYIYKTAPIMYTNPRVTFDHVRKIHPALWICAHVGSWLRTLFSLCCLCFQKSAGNVCIHLYQRSVGTLFIIIEKCCKCPTSVFAFELLCTKWLHRGKNRECLASSLPLSEHVTCDVHCVCTSAN